MIDRPKVLDHKGAQAFLCRAFDIRPWIERSDIGRDQLVDGLHRDSPLANSVHHRAEQFSFCSPPPLAQTTTKCNQELRRF